jgi:hypothetical protein
VPQLIRAFLDPDRPGTARALAAIGLPAGEIEQVLTESYPAAAVTRTVAAGAGSTVRYFRQAGALDDPGTADAFATAGLLDAGRRRSAG